MRWRYLGGLCLLAALIALLIHGSQRHKGGLQPAPKSVATSPVVPEFSLGAPGSRQVLKSGPDAEAEFAQALAEMFAKSDHSDLDGLSCAQLIALVKDETKALDLRKRALRSLARLGTPEAMAALKELLGDAKSELRATVAEALAECPSKEAKPMLMALLNDNDEDVVVGAIHGLASGNSPEALSALKALLLDPKRSSALRGEAAQSLAAMDSVPVDSVRELLSNVHDPALETAILQGLGTRPFSETQDVFMDYLQSSNLSPGTKAAVLESLGHSQGDASSLLMAFTTDTDPKVRASAAWALSSQTEQGAVGPQIMDLLQKESNPEIRRYLYQALGNQVNSEPQQVLELVKAERDPAARVAGLDLLAESLADGAGGNARDYFNTVAVPELKNQALNDPDAGQRLLAVIALQKAHTDASAQSLSELAQQATDPQVRQAAGVGSGRK